ncbi:MAG: aminodeoxychorismate/anthranilate synthase component II [Bacteroidetes bacterium]|nr:aminodeoxychorismate/anthranilate synthase component II [Bacteroidota bacterium]
MKRLLILDNYDSFTYNLVQLVKEINLGPIDIYRNDKITLDQVDQYEHILLSPGPGIPEEAGILLPLISHYAATKSIFGVCLGHQAIGQSFGARLLNLSDVYHGVSTPIVLNSAVAHHRRTNDWFGGFEQTLTAGRYHSWVIDATWVPECLEVTSTDQQGRIMSVRHREYDVQGVQFHPESILTVNGAQMIKNWLTNRM